MYISSRQTIKTAYQAMKTHPELVRLIAHLAQRAVDAGHEIKGVTVEEERKVA